MADPVVSPARRGDADAITDVFLAARAGLGFLPVLHTDDETRWWAEHVVLAEHDVVLVRDGNGVVRGFAAVRGAWLEHLYVHPEAQGRGLGTRLLTDVLDRAGDEVRLHVFLPNTGARRFYERHGFELVGTRDGSDNEEGVPDATYRWPRPAGAR
ncbi:GNAT family N-acetyltransferase [Kineococcus gynurae]|uniref:GNAT family N-acetyltransferase n=1 Tax=Kineococcus gynurae TaxID=452979 RepID=A0ABV5LV25_9ACTN